MGRTCPVVLDSPARPYRPALLIRIIPATPTHTELRAWAPWLWCSRPQPGVWESPNHRRNQGSYSVTPRPSCKARYTCPAISGLPVGARLSHADLGASTVLRSWELEGELQGHFFSCFFPQHPQPQAQTSTSSHAWGPRSQDAATLSLHGCMVRDTESLQSREKKCFPEKATLLVLSPCLLTSHFRSKNSERKR